MKRKTLSQTLITAAKELGFSKATVAELEQLDIVKSLADMVSACIFKPLCCMHFHGVVDRSRKQE